jgi:hypothetical protein
LLRDFQEINSPILWGGLPARPLIRTGWKPIPQEIIWVFFYLEVPKIGILPVLLILDPDACPCKYKIGEMPMLTL